jgi:hydroxypyruvate reductase
MRDRGGRAARGTAARHTRAVSDPGAPAGPGRAGRERRAQSERAFRAAVAACDPAARVAAAIDTLAAAGDPLLPVAARTGLALGKAALAMARGCPVARGLAVVPAGTAPRDPGAWPAGWLVMEGAHPVPDGRSAAAGAAALALAASVDPAGELVALVSGGASALAEVPRGPLADLAAVASALMAAGAPIAELNTVRAALSKLKAGGLALACPARVTTLAVSDVLGDALDVIGSGPTIGPWLAAPLGAAVDAGAPAEARRRAAVAILAGRGIAAPAALAPPQPPRWVARRDRAQLIAPLATFADAVVAALIAAGAPARRLDPPLTGDVTAAAARAAATEGVVVAWGEPTVRLPPGAGRGGRAQQLALALARAARGTARAALVAGSDGVDGPVPAGGDPAPAGAYVDGATWDAIAATGIDPEAALARCDAGTALAAVGALFVPGATGTNHADVAIVWAGH